MNIPKDLYLQLREVATTTCNNAFLMNDGRILTNAEYKKLGFMQKLEIVMYYNYNLNTVCKM